MFYPFAGQVTLIAGTYAPKGWLLCNGSTLLISDYQLLYAVIGNRYGGDGYTTFKLPDLRERIPNHRGNNFYQGMTGGWTHVQLTPNHLPAHNHPLRTSTSNVVESTPTNNVLSTVQSRYPTTLYANYAPSHVTSLAQDSLKNEGGSQPLATMPPYLTFNFIINYDGYYPSRP